MTTSEEKLNKLKELINLSNSGLTREEFTSNFKIIIDLIKSLKVANQQERESLLIMMKSFEAKISNDQTSEIDKISKELIAKLETGLNKIIFEKEAMTAEIDKRASDMEKSMPDEVLLAKTASEMAIVAIKPLILPKDDLKEEISKLGDLIVKTVNNLPAEDSWHIEDIYKLREELDELRQLRGRTFGGGGGLSRMTADGLYAPIGTTGGTPIDNEVVAGDTNTFTLANTPILGSEHLFGIGQRLTLTVDYSIAGAVITTVNPWSAGQIIADYKK
jgi:hypothetical protein